ncbi:MAG: hypothetical protein NXH75_13630, partial [Halobacteriovoraceae bacterium]|nr:hypothetical protein [Halobacteriovoraceae bacterium]
MQHDVCTLSRGHGGVFGVLMFTLNPFQKSLAVCLLVLFFTGCNQQEFYEKEFLEGVGIPEDTKEIPDNLDDEPKVVDNTTGGSTSGGSTTGGSTSGGSTTGGSTSGGSTTGGSTSGGSTTGGSTSGGSTTGGSTSGG